MRCDATPLIDSDVATYPRSWDQLFEAKRHGTDLQAQFKSEIDFAGQVRINLWGRDNSTTAHTTRT